MDGRANHGLDPWDFKHSGKIATFAEDDPFECHAISVSNDGTRLAAAGASPRSPAAAVARIFSVRARESSLEATITAEGAIGATSVALSRDAVFLGCADGSLWSFDFPTGVLTRHEPHPALAALPRRRRPIRNPFASGDREPRSIRRLIFVGDGHLVGSVSNHGVLPVWGRARERDAAPGELPDASPSAFHDDPSFSKEDGAFIHLASHGDFLYSTSIDAKGLRAWSCDSIGGRLWESERLAAGRGVHLAGIAVLPRREVPPLIATCVSSLIRGTSYAEPDTTLKIALVDGDSGRELRRYAVEGVGATNRFIDCSSLTGGGGGTLLFLAHKDGSIWIHAAMNGAQVAALHGHATWSGTSGHHRVLPTCVAAGSDGEFFYSATTDGKAVHRWTVGPPRVWSRDTHARFPSAFKATVRALVTAVHAREARGGGGGGGGASVLAAAAGIDGEVSEDGSGAPALWGKGFAELCAIESGILDLVIGGIAALAYGCEPGIGKEL